MWVNRWIIEWDDRTRHGEEVDTATTPEDALAICRRFLESETAFDEEQNEDRPALDVLFGDEDPLVLLKEMDDCLKVECEDGAFLIRRMVQFQEDTPPPRLDEAAAALLKFAQLFLAYYDNQTPEHVTIRTLEHTARAAVAMAAGNAPTTPLTPESIEKLKKHYLTWTGGFPPDDDDEIFTYIELAMESGPDPEEVRSILRNWMQGIDAENHVPRPTVVVHRNNDD
ncbi:MAG: hypothetical protein L0Y72_10660 [Gemmataceae bacterium]|nr:hypothetical protein [Gemmataceae bacterium]MCI0739495.1 hypothetical protein [Gemmataceae bacterium]